MKIKHFSKLQAFAICKDYQYLVGKRFSIDDKNNTLVSQVIMAPYSKILQWQFIRSILKGVEFEEALNIVRNGRFTVIVLPDIKQEPLKSGMVIKPLINYLSEFNIKFELSIYVPR